MCDAQRHRRPLLQILRAAAQRWLIASLALLCGLRALQGGLLAQVEMPDPAQMSGIALPAADLPDGTVSVRLIRRQLSDNIIQHRVQLLIDAKSREATTDEFGRARFTNVPAGVSLKAVAQVQDERLESQEFQMPARGGIRLMLVARGHSTAAGVEERAAAPAVEGRGPAVAISENSRFVIEIVNEAVQLFELLELVHPSSGALDLQTPLVFDMPAGARGTTLLEGTSELASVSGTRVQVRGPLPAGRTVVQVAMELPYSGAELRIRQRLPVPLANLIVVTEKLGALRVQSDRLTASQEVKTQGQTYIMARGGPVPPAQEIEIVLTGLPQHARWPAYLALILAVSALIWAALAIARPHRKASADRSPQASREERAGTFERLVDLERQFQQKRVNVLVYRRSREELIDHLARIDRQLADAEHAA